MRREGLAPLLWYLVFFLITLAKPGDCQAVCQIWTGILCVRYQCTPQEALTHNDNCFPVAPTPVPTFPPTTVGPTISPSSAPTMMPSRNPAVFFIPKDISISPTTSPTSMPSDTCRELNGFVICCPSLTACLATTAGYVVTGKSWYILIIPWLLGRMNDNEEDDAADSDETSIIPAGSDLENGEPGQADHRSTKPLNAAKRVQSCCIPVCCLIPLRDIRWRHDGPKHPETSTAEYRFRWKNLALEAINAGTTVLFIMSLWVVAATSYGVPLGIFENLSQTELLRPFDSTACGLDPDQGFNRTLAKAETVIDPLGLAQIATLLLVVRLTIRILLAFFNLCRHWSILPKLRCGSLFIYFRILVFGLLFSGFNPWSGSMKVWTSFPTETTKIELRDRTLAVRETIILFLLLLAERLPFIMIEYYLTLKDEGLLTVAGSLDLAVNILSISTQYFEFISVLELYGEM